jgi:hypothetical protein
MDLTAPTTLLHAWLLAPAVMVVGMAGLGLGLSTLAGMRLGALTLPAGFLAGAALMSFLLGVGVDGVPAIVVCALAALAGLTLWVRAALIRRRGASPTSSGAVRVGGRRLDPLAWPALAFLAAYGIGLAPLVGSGRAGVLGYVLNNDPATHLSVVELLRAHGASAVDVQSGTYHFVSGLFTSGYPVGSHVWVLFTSLFALVDPFLIWTPVISVGLGLIALASYALLRDLALPRSAAALAAVLVGCGYLTYSYAAQGGAKEVFASVSVYGTIALILLGVDRGATVRTLLPGALGLAAGLAVFGLAIAPWLGTAAAVAAAMLLWRAADRHERLRRLGVLAGVGGVAAVLSVPAILSSIRFARMSGEAIENPAQTGNLLGPVPWIEAFNVWLGSDYRYPTPEFALITYVLIVLAAVLATVGIAYALRMRRPAVPLALVAAVVGALFVSARYAVYFDAKTYMLLAPALGTATAAGAWALVRVAGGRSFARLGALAVATVLALGALASDALVYAGAWVTPKDRFRELTTIADRLDGDGPVLIADREEYARYFLRDANPWDDWGEWQPRRNFRFGAIPPHPPRGPDLDDYTHEHIQSFQLLLERKRPGGSRAPGNFDVVFETPSYRVWRRAAGPPAMHLSLGLETMNGRGRLDCATPEAAALLDAATASGSRVRISRGVERVVTSPPDRWQAYGAVWPGPAPGLLHRSGGFAIAYPRLEAGRYDVWAQGAFGPGFRLFLGQDTLGDVFGDLGLHSGWRLIEAGVRVSRSDPQFVIAGLEKPRWQSGWRRPDLHGPLAFVPSAFELETTTVSPGRARRLCGESLDWVELRG